jgi:type IV secretory pathway TraG/TraD family ATPase VirD4
VGIPLLGALGYAGGRWLTRVQSTEPKYRRGAVVKKHETTDRSRVATPAQVGPGSGFPLTLAGIPIPLEDETKHFKFIGTTGTGKSTAIRELLSAALARGDRAVIADPDGGYLRHFYDAARGDIILNPFEPDSVRWTPLGEIANDYDIDQLARSLIPDSGDDRNWSEYARTFFISVVQVLRAAQVKEDRELYDAITRRSVKELKSMLAKTSAAPFLEDGNERMFGSVRSITSSAVQALKYMLEPKTAPFSVRQWVRQGAATHEGGKGGVLFLPYKAGEIAALRSMISAWMRIAIFEAMDRSEGDQRLWFVVDELDALGKIDGLKDALARLRKFGGRCILGFQSMSQVSSTYRHGEAHTIVENCGNTLILRCSASEDGGTSQFASRLIGQRQVLQYTKARTRSSRQWRTSSTTTSEHLAVEQAVMASEIERLKDLEGFLKFTSDPDWLRVTLTPVKYPTVTHSAPPKANTASAAESSG